MKICLAQYNIVWESKAENMKNCERFFLEASKKNADLIVFPELSLTGFTMNTSLAELLDGETVLFFTECAKRYNVPCVFGYAEKKGTDVYNRLAYTDKAGNIVRYSKIHPFSFGGESEVYSSGDSSVSFICGDMEFGLTVCYDLRFPELYQHLSKKCGCIIVSANWPRSRREHWLTLLKARSIENQCYIIGCNRVGSGGGLEYSGDSVVFSPDGKIAAFAADGMEQLLFSEICADTVNELRRSFPLKNDRRSDIYRNFYE